MDERCCYVCGRHRGERCKVQETPLQRVGQIKGLCLRPEIPQIDKMRVKRIFNTARALPRMSWEPVNLFNLWQRSLGPVSGRDQVTFKKTDLSLFKQRWRSKRLVRAYHGDYIQEKRFKRWWLPELLPDIRTRRPNKATELLRIANRPKDALKHEEDAKAQDEALARAPVGSLMFQEIERRLDTLVFRACFASSIYKARQLVLHGHVKLNGAKVRSKENSKLVTDRLF